MNILYYLKHYPLSWLCIIVIWILCFCNMPETPLDDVDYIDKWTHIAMYAGTCSVIWIEYLRCHEGLNRRKLLLWAVIAPIVMSGVIEILQATCTGGRRNGDWLDFAANTIGVGLAVLVGLLAARCFAKR